MRRPRRTDAIPSGVAPNGRPGPDDESDQGDHDDPLSTPSRSGEPAAYAAVDRRRISVPDEVVSAEAKLVWFYVVAASPCTVEELCQSLRLCKLTLFPVLRSLEDRGLIRRDGGRYSPAD